MVVPARSWLVRVRSWDTIILCSTIRGFCAHVGSFGAHVTAFGVGPVCVKSVDGLISTRSRCLDDFKY